MESYAMKVEIPASVIGGPIQTVRVMLNVKNRMEAIERVTAEIHPEAAVVRMDGPYPFNKRVNNR